MANHNLLKQIYNYGGGTRQQCSYGVLAVAAASMIGILTASSSSKNKNNNDNNTAIKEEDLSRHQLLSTGRHHISKNPDTSTGNVNVNPSSSTWTRSEILKNTIDDMLSNSMTVDPCLCERRTTQQVRDDNPAYTSNTQSISSQDRRALLRKHKTLRLLNELKTEASVESKYEWNKDEIIGEGAYSKVYQAVSKDTGEVVALKDISKKFTDSKYFQQEVEAMLYIQEKGGHPRVITLHEHFEDKDKFILILDFIRGGELFDHLIAKGAYSELDASRLIREVASALLFLHGIGLVHADLKPENILLTTTRRGDSVVKVADFGTAVFVGYDSDTTVTNKKELQPEKVYGAPTPAYSPPESILRSSPVQPSMDMWSLGVILFIMLTGCHPYDVTGESTEVEIEDRIKDKRYKIPINDPNISGHLSKSAKDLITKLMNRNHRKRLTAYQMLQHPWVRGETASMAIIQGSDQRLSKFRLFKSRLQAKFFENAIRWSDLRNDPDGDSKRKTGLIEQAFNALDTDKDGNLDTKGILGTGDENIEEIVEGEGPTINISDYENLLSENMQNRYYPAGHTIYKQDATGHAMYFLESGAVEVVANGTRAVRTGGDFFGEGALLHPRKIRSASVRCLTPVHALEISQEYFEKYIASSGSGLYLTLKEKDKIRKRNRAKTILKMQKELKTVVKPRNGTFYQDRDEGDTMFILEKGKVDIQVASGQTVFSVYPGNIFGEHAAITCMKRNCDAKCVSNEGCIAQELQGYKFRELLESSTSMKDSIKELYLRREFKKAIVMRIRKSFPYDDPEEAFAAADNKHVGRLDRENISALMREMNPNFTDEEVDDVIHSLNLTGSGSVTFDEMKKSLVGDIRTSASM